MSTSMIGLAGLGVQSSARERRRAPRYPFTGTVEVFETESETRMQGRTADLSEGGCYVDTMSPFPAQSRVRIRITREQRSFESQATVVYSVSGMGMGLQFEATDARQLANLRKWIGELSGETTAELGELGTEQKEDSATRMATHGSILNQLIAELMRKNVLAEATGKEMLQRLASA